MNRFDTMLLRMLRHFYRFLIQLLLWIIKYLGIKVDGKKFILIEQFTKFILIGVLNSLITLLINYLFIWWDPNLYLLGNAVGYAAGIINSFYWNSRYVFSDMKQDKKSTFIKMTICYSTTYFLQAGLLYVLVNLLHVSNLAAPIICIVVATPINFVFNKFWAFGNSR